METACICDARTGEPSRRRALNCEGRLDAPLDFYDDPLGLGAHPNHGVLLEEDGGARTAFRSSEHHAASQRPRIEVCYTPY
ncbi:hypothetical protein WME99_33175 [Sorangium sp. So ce136]|uniref:hypothetical protein n=1 Tax=Sorangium sp. So ce136 TaxID=3133284 RepID=UPI003F036BE4